MDYAHIFEMNIGLTSKIIKIINQAKSLATNVKENSNEDSDCWKKADDLLRTIDGVEF